MRSSRSSSSTTRCRRSSTPSRRPSAPPIYDEHDSNVVFKRVFSWGDVDAAFAAADKVLTEKFRWHRLGANPLECNGVISEWDVVDNTVTARGSFQSQVNMGLLSAGAFGVPSNKVRIVSQPHGGSFGGKGGPRGTVITALLSRKAGGRPVKWIEDRMEYLAGGAGQSWDRYYEVSLALKNDGTITGLRVVLLDDLGASAEGFGAVSAAKPLAAFTGPYAIPVAEYDLTLVATNKLPQSPYRGMGPPPHNWVLEQMVDRAAAELELDPAEIRRRNFIPERRLSLHDPERQRVRQRRLRGRSRRGFADVRLRGAAPRAGGGAPAGALPRDRSGQHHRARCLRLERLRDRRQPGRPAFPKVPPSASTSSARSSPRSASRSRDRGSTR
jgi:CO/xanthine dehydrogenase Mo-binding subunit